MTEMLLQSHERFADPKTGMEGCVMDLLPARYGLVTREVELTKGKNSVGTTVMAETP